MTFLLTFFKILFLFLLVGFVGMLGTREALLYFAGQQLVSDVRTLTQPSQWDKMTPLCESTNPAEIPFDGFQLRFVSDTSYKVEVHCLTSLAGEYKTGKLPYQVKKTTGSPGFFYDFASRNLVGEVTLELWGQRRIVFADNARPSQSWGKTTLQSSVPASVCAAHGFGCCDAVQEIGVGDAIRDGVTDCPGGCFASCQKRPLLLSFNSDPQVKHETRQAIVPAQQGSVIFTFLFDDSESSLGKAVIDFGDGTSQEVTTRNGQVTKDYQCSQARCVFTARVMGTDVRGIESAQTRLSEIEVVLDPLAVNVR